MPTGPPVFRHRAASEKTMSHFWPVILLAGILPFGGDGDTHRFPVEAEGNIRFYLDSARFLEDEDVVTEIYLAIPLQGLAESPDSTGFCHLSIKVEFEDADGDKIGSVENESWVPLGTELDGRGVLQPRHLRTLRPDFPHGTHQLSVTVKDLEGRKRGLLDRIRGKKPSGTARARFDTEPFPCGFSDIAFVWDLNRGPGMQDAGVRQRLQLNPQRFYGLFKTTLLFYLERYSEIGEVAYAITSLADQSVVTAGADESGSSGIDVGPSLIGHDVSKLPAGSYRLDVWRVGEDSCRTARDFQVLWDTASWTQDQKALMEEAFVLLGPVEYEEVREMSRGEAETYLRDLWARNDPNPSTGHNELRDIFDERVTHANTFYGSSFRKGMLSDRGRVYIRYGPPDEIENELSPQDRSAIAQAWPDAGAGDDPAIIHWQPSSGMSDDPANDVGPGMVRKPFNPHPRDPRAYEVWRYQVRGAPLFPDQLNPVQRTGLKFIFVDELGYGDMRLIHTNISGGF